MRFSDLGLEHQESYRRGVASRKVPSRRSLFPADGELIHSKSTAAEPARSFRPARVRAADAVTRHASAQGVQIANFPGC